MIRQVAQLLLDAPDVLVATLCEAIDDAARLFDPNVVKVVRDVAGRARYFSRAPIPWRRDDFANAVARSTRADATRVVAPHRHLRLSRGRVSPDSARLPAGVLEQIESLEQLRLLENAIEIAVGEAVAEVPGGVDTPADLERVRALLAGR